MYFAKCIEVPKHGYPLFHINSCTKSLHMSLCVGNLSRWEILLDHFELGWEEEEK